MPAQVAVAAALLAGNSNLNAVLCSFFKEDLISWMVRKSRGAGQGSLHISSETIKSLVVRNTYKVRGFIQVLAAHISCLCKGCSVNKCCSVHNSNVQQQHHNYDVWMSTSLAGFVAC